MNGRFRSLRARLLLPLVAVSFLTALAVAFGSYWLGDRWARQQISARYQGIADSISGAPFPLTPQVVDLLADLTNTEMLALRSDGSVAEASIALTVPVSTRKFRISKSTTTMPVNRIRIEDRGYQFGMFPRGGPGAGGDGVDRVVVLFDETAIRESRWRAAALPLVTGLSTVVFLTSIALLLTGRLVRRLQRLGQQVDEIAEGQFSTTIVPGVHDEVGLLATGVQRMSGQLQQMWDSLNRRQGEKLLHQIAGGLAHQLRNSLTGARMALELHSQKCESDSSETLPVALSQLEQTEDAVRRLLLVAAGKQDDDRPGSVSQSIEDVRHSLSPSASHLKVDLRWDVDAQLDRFDVSDAPSLTAALSNLVLNSIQIARHVKVSARCRDRGTLEIEVSDDGPGLDPEIADKLFEPFVTTKPEGLGLGLPLVARAAARLGGNVNWQRSDDRTRFVLTCLITSRGFAAPGETK